MRFEDTKKAVDAVFSEVRKVVIGQDAMLQQMFVALLTNSHALLEGYPGLAKTLAVRTFSDVLDLKFSRIQNTPDLMPSDITGTYIIEESSGGKRSFKFQQGPIFANLVLADEINRATPKTQSAMLEAMQEKQVTVGNSTFKLEEPFFVLATQNPIEQEGSLALDQSVFINGELKTGRELLDCVGDDCLVEDRNGTKLYDIDGWTLSLDVTGKLVRKKCFLYTVPYKNELVVVTTRTGKKIKVTKNHPFLVNDEGIIVWKKAEALTKNDYLVNPARIPFVEQKRVMSHEEAVSRMSQVPLKKEIPFDVDFAFWSAFLLSDGFIGEKCVEAVQKNYPAALDRFVEVSRKYGFEPAVLTNRGCRYARIYSKPLVEYLRIRFGIVGGKDKEIPSWFLSWPENMNREFLKTFISLESSLRDNRVVFTQKSARNVNIISYMLLREGVLSFPRHDGNIFRLKIQGEDVIKFLVQIGWVSDEKAKDIDVQRTPKSSFRVVPVDRQKILGLVECLGLNSFHTLKGRKDLTSREWYGSYRGIIDGETVMSVESLKSFVKDMEQEIAMLKNPAFLESLRANPRSFSAHIGLPITEISEQLHISKNQVWSLYEGGNPESGSQIVQFMQSQQMRCVEEAELLLKYCEALLSEDVYYDRIKLLECVESEGLAFGLTVPELQNYVGGFGGCGINHNTYPLPEAQSDRFLLKILATYPSEAEELAIVDLYAEESHKPQLKKVLDAESLKYLQQLTRKMPIAQDLKKYVVGLIISTRNKKDLIEYGASPRASIGLVLAAKAHALLSGRKYVSKDDINKMAFPVLRHRIILTFEAERQNLHEDDVVKRLLK